MTEYTVKAYPTEYWGRTYRSRLEARWAAFFDLLGWKHEYEPFDLGKWSPDFLLTDMNALVEVKPITELCEATCEKMVEACAERGLIPGAKYNNKINSLILLGAFPSVWELPCDGTEVVRVGWVAVGAHFFGLWEDATIGWGFILNEGRHRPEIIYANEDRWYSANGRNGGWDNTESPIAPYRDFTARLWSKASSIVQWRPA